MNCLNNDDSYWALGSKCEPRLNQPFVPFDPFAFPRRPCPYHTQLNRCIVALADETGIGVIVRRLDRTEVEHGSHR